jgi:hypothetical protein
LLGEYEVSISDLSDTAFAFLEEIFRKKNGKLTKGALAPYMEIIREFYVNYDSFDLDKKSITSKVRGQTLALSPFVIRDLYGMPKVSNSSFPFKGIRTPSKT